MKTCNARTLPGFVALLLCLLAAALPAAPPTGYAAAVGTMQREQTLGEAGAGLLKTFGKGDAATFAQGIRLYTQAQGEFNALIETLKAGLIADGDPVGSTDLAAGLTRAADKRAAFLSFIDKRVIPKAGGTRSLAAFIGGGDIVGSVVELIGILKDASLEVWKEYRAADRERRKQILEQLNGLKWRSFGEVPALG